MSFGSALKELEGEAEVSLALRAAGRLADTASLEGPSVAGPLVEAVAGGDPVLAIGALHALAAVVGPVADVGLAEALDDDRPWLREHAAWALAARVPQPSTFGRLVGSLAAPSGFTAMVAQRTLQGWARSDPSIAAVVEAALVMAEATSVRRRLVDTLGGIAGERVTRLLLRVANDSAEHLDTRVAAVGALGGRPGGGVEADLRGLATGDSEPLAVQALLALEDGRAQPGPLPAQPGLRVAQFSVVGELDGQLSQGGAGDTGGVASLLVALSTELAGRAEITHVLTIGRSSPAGELAALASPDGHHEGYGAVSFGSIGAPPSLAEEWEYRLMVERAVRRALRARPPVDLLHLRMADVGTLAASSVARQLRRPTVFTCAADPHVALAARQRAGNIDRDRFGAADLDEHLWFRARMVERLAANADHLVLFPRPTAGRELTELVGVPAERLAASATVVPEGIDLDGVDAALADVRAHGATLAVLQDLAGALPRHRHGLPLVVTVGRLHPIKGVERLVAAWIGDPVLSATTNLVVVGGDLERPNPTEQAVLDRIGALLADAGAAGDGVVLLGARPRRQAAQVVAAAALGVSDLAPGGGVYANGAAKEEFGLALLEALASGLPVVAPAVGGPATYVDDGVTGVLVPPDGDLAAALHRAMPLDRSSGRARREVEERYTVQAMTDALLRAYTAIPVAAVTT